jgi:SAM-dependent methyltransferase
VTYDPAAYWGGLVTGDGDLAHVGIPGLGPYNRHAYRFRLRALRHALADLDLRGRTVFESGFGEGFYLGYWHAAGAAAVAGVDLTPGALAGARRRFPSYDLRLGDLTRAADLTGFGTCDLVTALDVLYHIVDDDGFAAALRHLAALVAPGGRLLLSDKFPSELPYQRFPHVRRRPLAHYRAVLEPCGLRLVRLVPVFCLMDEPLAVGAHPILGALCALQWRVGTKALRLAARHPRLQAGLASTLAGAQRLPEGALLRLLARVPNTEIAVWERSPSEGGAA